MQNNFIKSFFILMFVILINPSWGGFKRIEITQGLVKPEPIAIQNFTSNNESTAIKLAQIMRDDLKNSGLFISLNPDDYSHLMNSEKPRISEWRTLHVKYVVMADVQDAEGKIKITFRLYDVMTGLQMTGMVLKADSSHVRKLAHMASDAIFQRITGEKGFFDTKIAFIDEKGNRVKRVKRLAIMDYDGHNVKYLTDGKNLVLTPRFSNNNKELAYLSFNKFRDRSFISVKANVHLFNLRNGQKNSLGNFHGMTFSPFFSKDGSKILMSFTKNGQTAIYKMNRSTRKISPVTPLVGIDTSPCFSEDEDSIVFTSDRSGKEQIYTMDADGHNVRRISFGNGKYSEPSVSPRGDKIAFTKQFKGKFYIGVMNSDGSGERLIYQTRNVAERPCWAPNGRYILFSEESVAIGGKSRLVMMDLTGRYKMVIKTPQGASDGAWSGLLSSGS
jgi:TolB protein